MELLTILINILNNFISFQSKTYILSPKKDFYYNSISIVYCPVTVPNMGWGKFFVLLCLEISAYVYDSSLKISGP